MRISMVFQKPNPFPKSIYENVAYGLRVQGIRDRNTINQRVEEALRGAALWNEVKDRLNEPGTAPWPAATLHCVWPLAPTRKYFHLRRLGLWPDPEIILFDEPTSALDPIATASVEELIDEYKGKVTVLIVTHNMQQAARVSKYTAFMYLGEVVEFGATGELFTNPREKRTQDYITGRSRLTVKVGTMSPSRSNEHIVRAFGQELEQISNIIIRMAGSGGSSGRGRGASCRPARCGKGRSGHTGGSSARSAAAGYRQRDAASAGTAPADGIDLREILAAVKIALNIERIGDYASNIAKRALALAQVPPVRPASGCRAWIAWSRRS